MPQGRLTRFDEKWMNYKDCNDDKISMWALRVPYEEYQVHCRACNKSVIISSMGMQALKSHSKAMGHIKAINNFRNQAQVTSFFEKDSTTSIKTPSCTKAEVMWALHVVEQHSSFQSSEHLVNFSKGYSLIPSCLHACVFHLESYHTYWPMVFTCA